VNQDFEALLAAQAGGDSNLLARLRWAVTVATVRAQVGHEPQPPAFSKDGDLHGGISG
jgi:hypothetical protein